MLDRPVLVLNRFWQAVHICSARRAFALLFTGQAHAVETGDGSFLTHDFDSWRSLSQREPEDEMVNTVSFRIRIPRVIVVLFFDRIPRREVKFTRHNIYERDSNTCQYCGKVFDRKDLNLDHVVPRDHGGGTNWENIVCSCIPCNTRKANRTPAQAGMRLIKKPERPKWRPFIHLTFGTTLHESWKHFVDTAYWHVELGGDPATP
jgi:5-methylcytosine-specific restriction endonuclease McrA